MKTPTVLQLNGNSTRTYLLAIIAIAAVVAAATLVLRSDEGSAPVAADSASAPATAPATAGFIKFDGIDGESKDSNHDKWIDVLSISYGIFRPIASGISGSTRQRASATFGDIVMVKEIDKSSPKLQEKIATGEVIPKLEIELTSATRNADTREPYLKYELTNVLITSYRISGSTSASDVPTETLAINFEEIKVTYTEFGDDGRSRGTTETTWKVEEGVK